MTARIHDSSFQLPNITAAPRDFNARPLLHRDECHLYDAGRPGGAFRGLAIALALEFAIALVGFSGWSLWHLLR
jgi:hypothetical protein